MKVLPVPEPPGHQTKQSRKHGPGRNGHHHSTVPYRDKLQDEVKEHSQIHATGQADDETRSRKHLPGNGESTHQIAGRQQGEGEDEGGLAPDEIRHLPRYETAGQKAAHLDGGDGGWDPLLVTNQTPLNEMDPTIFITIAIWTCVCMKQITVF